MEVVTQLRVGAVGGGGEEGGAGVHLHNILIYIQLSTRIVCHHSALEEKKDTCSKCAGVSLIRGERIYLVAVIRPTHGNSHLVQICEVSLVPGSVLLEPLRKNLGVNDNLV